MRRDDLLCEAEWFSIAWQMDVKFLTIHSSYEAIKHCGKFSDNGIFG